MSVRSESQLLDLVRLAYAAASNPDEWRPFLENYCRAMGALCVSLMFFDRARVRSSISVFAGPALTADTWARYNSYYGAHNPMMRTAIKSVRPGDITLGQEIYPIDRLMRTEYYSDFIRPLDIGAVMGAWLLEANGVYANISCLRSLRTGVYDRHDAGFVRPLVPHLQRALQIHRRLDGLRLDHRSDAGALDRLDIGLFVVTPGGHIILANASGRQILAARDGLASSRDGLCADSGRDTKRLRALIAQAGHGAKGASLHAGGVLRVSRPSMRTPLSILVAPTAPAIAYPALPPGCVTLLVRDPDMALDTSRLLPLLYGLTPAETRLADRLLRGQSLDTYGAEMQVSRETARTHLKSILKKSGTRRQAEFIRRATLVSQVRGAGPGHA
jgi:DNA-binding CsgD family transcriptional regulator